MNRSLIALLPLSLGLASCQSLGDVPTERLGSTTLRFANGLPAGTAQLVGSGNSVTFSAALAGFSAGTNAIHIHTTGRCDAPDFTSAGGHLNPGGHEHGTSNPAGAHLGDLPNVTITSSGTGTITAQLRGDRASVLSAIFDEDGAAVVVHAGPDDYLTDPAGNAGARIACGVLRPA